MKRSLFPASKAATVFIFLASFFLSSLLLASTLQAQLIDTSFYYRITNKWQEGKSLGLSYDGTVNRPILKPTDNTPTQYWKITVDPFENYRIINMRQGSGLSLQVDKDKNKLALAAADKSVSQVWKIYSNGDGTFRITSLWLGTDKSWDVVNDGSNNQIILAATAGFAGQFWQFTPQPKPAVVVAKPDIDTESFYRITNGWQRDKSLAVANDEMHTDHPMILPTEDNSNQYWKFTLGDNGYYRITNQQYLDGMSLDIINDGTNNNRMALTPFNNYSGQYWKLTPERNGTYRLTSLWQGNSKALDIVNDGTDNNELILNPTGNYSGQYWTLTKQVVEAPKVIEPTPVKTLVKDRLMAGEELLPKMKIVSANGRFTLIQQGDGNLVIYNDKNRPTWASHTNGKTVKNCIMQTDGNLVQYLPYHVAVWASNTHGNPGAYLVMQNDGNLVIYGKNNKPLWATNTVE